MPLLTISSASLAYGDLPLLDDASFALEPGERIGLIGRNGTGKSSLLGAIAGTLALDDGEIRKRDGLSVTLVSQEPDVPERSAAPAHVLEKTSTLQPGCASGLGGSGSAPPSPTPSPSSPTCCCWMNPRPP